MCRVYTHIDLPMKTKKEIHDKTIRLIPLSVAILLNILVLVLLLSFIGNTVVYLGDKTRFTNDYKMYITIYNSESNYSIYYEYIELESYGLILQDLFSS